MTESSSSQLLFISWKTRHWRTGSVYDTEYHLACEKDGVIHSACGMTILSNAKQPDYSSTIEPPALGVCPTCSNRAAEFSKKHFGGKKLAFKRSATRTLKKKSHESDEEMYRPTAKRPGDLF